MLPAGVENGGELMTGDGEQGAETIDSASGGGDRGARQLSLRPSRIGFAALAAILLVAGLVVFALVVSGGPGPGISDAAADDDPEHRGSVPTLDVPEVRQAQEQARAQQQQREKELATPEAKRRRQESRSAYRHLSRGEAHALARDSFPAAARDDVTGRFRLGAGEHVERYAGRHGAVISRADGKRAVVQSLQPMQSDVGDGRLSPVDLTLQETDEAASPKNPLSRVRLAKTLDGGVRFADQDFGMRLLAPESPKGVVQDDRMFFGNVDVDTDFFVAPESSGAETYLQLRSPESPDHFSFEFDLPEGYSLRPVRAPKGVPQTDGGPIAVVHGSQEVGLILPPSAADADGQSVPVTSQVEGHRLELSVAHRDGDYRYPVLVDPDVLVRFDSFSSNCADATNAGWSYGTNAVNSVGQQLIPPTCSISGNDGLVAYAYGNYTYQPGQYGEWYYDATCAYRGNGPCASDRDYYAYRFDFGRVTHIPDGTNLQEGVWKGASWGWQSGVWGNPTVSTDNGTSPMLSYPWRIGGYYHTHCFPDQQCRWDGDPEPRNEGVFALQFPAKHLTGSWPYVTFRRAYSYIWDVDVPTTDASQQGLPAGEWVSHANVSVNAHARDAGIGMRNLTLDIDWTQNQAADNGCVAPQPPRMCPADMNASFGYSTDNLPEGDRIMRVRGVGFTGREGATPWWHVKIDRSPPSLTLSGALKDAAGQRLNDQTYGLHAESADLYSGARELEIQIDGKRVSDSSQSCASGGCSMARDWTFQPERYAAGEHTVTVIARDQLNQANRQSFTIKVAHAAGEDIGPGHVNLLTGNLALSEDDVQVPSFGADLRLSRAYNSRDASAGANGPFGPGWVSSVPVDEADAAYVQLTDTTANPDGSANPDGIVEITTADGDSFDFTKRADGGFDPAPGLEDLTLRPVTGGYTLSGRDGNVTRFTQAAGGGVLKPSEVRQPGKANTTSFTYEAVGGVTRVKQVFAPTAAGVDCSAGVARGCRALSFEYATGTTAAGSSPDQWGDYTGRLRRVLLIAWDPETSAMKTDAVAQYAYDNAGRLRSEWDPRVSPALKETYDYDAAGLLIADTPPGEQPWNFSYGTVQSDPNPGRLRSASRPGPAGTATTTVAYEVALSGSGAPYKMDAGDVAAWGQKDVPLTATVIFPPDQVPADPPSSFSRATVHYLDAQGRQVNVAAPGGRIITSEYDNHDNVVRQLTAANRQRALAAASPAQRAGELDTQRTYNAEGTQLLDEVGPSHAVKLESGETVQARAHTHTAYDEGAPAGGPFDLPTTKTEGAQIAGRTTDADVRMTKVAYDGQNGLGWTLRQPTSVTVDPGGLNLVRRTLYDDESGQQIETRQPANPNGGDAHATQSVSFTSGANTTDADCADRPEWAGLLCKTKPAAQPGAAGLPDLPVSTYTYNRLNEVVTKTDVVGTKTRITTKRYDDGGRVVSEAVSGDDGVPLPATETTYDPATGRKSTTASTTNGATTSITRRFDSLGELVQYADADGNVTKIDYDLLGRKTMVDDGKGTQRYTYDPKTGELVQLDDSAVGAFTAGYDADGKLVREDLPNGLETRTTVDEDGNQVERRYEKIASCSSNCTWLDFQVAVSIHGEQVAQTSSLSNQDFRYDPAGRLSQVRDTLPGKGCTVRDYTFDADSNRMALTSHASGADGSCDATAASTGTAHRYDAADRLTDSGYAYDTWGRITRLPGTDANGGELTADYYIDDHVHSLTQDGVTHTFTPDPQDRVRARSTAGGDGQTQTFHYADDTDSPAWTTESTDGSQWTRNIAGITGDLAAVQDSNGTTALQLTNLHGDVVGTANLDPNAIGPTKTFEADEFGVPRTSAVGRYGWLGAKRRSTDLPSGVITMGDRVYDPALGRFLQTDPEPGGSANAYDYSNADPVNGRDLDGRRAGPGRITDPFHWHYRGPWGFFGPRGGPITRVQIDASIGFNGRQVQVNFSAYVANGHPLHFVHRVLCRRQRFGPDAGCGQRGAGSRGARRRFGRSWSFLLERPDEYHLDFSQRVDWPRIPGWSGGFYFSTPTFHCRPRCRFY